MLELVRAVDWWQYKVAPAVALFVGTALVEGKAPLTLWREGALLVLALAVCASYVSVINDLCDRADDLAAGKPNRQIARGRGPVIMLLVSTILAGSMIAWVWRGEPLLVASYAGSWLAYSLYSLPPVRLKARGLTGAICDAAGAHLFPALTAILAAGFSGHNRLWLVAAAVCALAYGVRGILWHQLADYECDVRSGVKTFAGRHPDVAAPLGAFVAFPVELIALAILLWQIAQPLPLFALGCYVLLLAQRARSGLPIVVVVPRPHCITVLQEYYDFFLPLSLLLCAVERDGRAIVLVAAFLALFPNSPYRVAVDFMQFASILRGIVRAPRARMSS